VLDVDQSYGPSKKIPGLAYEQKGNYEQSINVYLDWLKSVPDNPDCLALLGHAYALSGKRVEAKAILSRLQQLSASRYVKPFDMAIVYIGLGDLDRSFDW
jgi:eukaryotic-like serine/threonine-protein kinase